MDRTRKLAAALAALGVEAALTGRPVRAWLPGHQDSAIVVMPIWMADRSGRPWRRRLPRPLWWWQRGNSSGWRRRAGTHGTAMGVAALLRQQR